MTKVLEFCQSPANPFEKLVRQEQLLHCTSIHAHLNNPSVMRLELLPGVTTLFRDSEEAYPWCL